MTELVYNWWSLFVRLIECGATLLVNMCDIEPRKEDDGFDGAFLSPLISFFVLRKVFS